MNNSFSTDVRRHLAQIRDTEACCRRTLLQVLLQVYLARRPPRGGDTVDLELESGPTARLVFTLGREFCGAGASLELHNLSGTCALHLPRQEMEAMLNLDRRSFPRACCRRAYLRGAFVACGSLVSPQKSYHLEFDAPPAIIEKVEQVCLREAIILKQYRRPRRPGQVTGYLKNGEAIVSFLSLIGAHKAVLAWQEVVIEKDMRNIVQRTVNCDTSNIAKTVRSSQQLLADIERMRADGRLRGLPEPLRQAAMLRETFPFATLQELADLAEPAITKSGLNHRLRQLRRLAGVPTR